MSTFPQKTVDINHVLTFGKHKGESIKELITNDFQYLTWLQKQKAIKLDEDTFREYLIEYIYSSINADDSSDLFWD